MSDIRTRIVTTSDAQTYSKIYDLRERVLRNPIGLSLKNEDLSADALDKIVIAERGDNLLGCVMIHPTDNSNVLKLRQMAVEPDVQKDGIGRILMVAAEKECKNSGAEKIALHARITAEGFYKKLGYKTTSEEFTEVGIPHVIMEKQL